MMMLFSHSRLLFLPVEFNRSNMEPHVDPPKGRLRRSLRRANTDPGPTSVSEDLGSKSRRPARFRALAQALPHHATAVAGPDPSGTDAEQGNTHNMNALTIESAISTENTALHQNSALSPTAVC